MKLVFLVCLLATTCHADTYWQFDYIDHNVGFSFLSRTSDPSMDYALAGNGTRGDFTTIALGDVTIARPGVEAQALITWQNNDLHVFFDAMDTNGPIFNNVSAFTIQFMSLGTFLGTDTVGFGLPGSPILTITESPEPAGTAFVGIALVLITLVRRRSLPLTTWKTESIPTAD
jgi:hypothetical protein